MIQLVSSGMSVTVSWKVQDPRLRISSDNRKWAVVYRKTSDSPYQMTLVPTQLPLTRESVMTQRISNLQPMTNYIVCVALVQDGKYTIEPNKCRRVTTKKIQDVGEDAENALEQNGAALTGRNIKTDVEEMTVSATSITIRWQLKVLEPYFQNGDSVSVRHEWTIRIRRTGSDNYTDIPVYDITSATETNGQLYEYGISDLAPRTHYDVCLIDVEHRPIGDRITAEPMDTLHTKINDSSACQTIQTSSNNILYATEIAAIALACAICFIVSAVTIFLCRQKKLLHWEPKKFTKIFCKKQKERPQPIGCNKNTSTSIPRVRYEPHFCERTLQKNFLESWNSLRLPYTDFTNSEKPPEFRSFRTTGYKDALTSVTIYKSGFSEC